MEKPLPVASSGPPNAECGFRIAEWRMQDSGFRNGKGLPVFRSRIEWMQACRGALPRARVRGGETDRDESFRAWWASEKIVFNFLVVGTMKERKLNLISEDKR
jgi:hypothetical protein